MKLSAKEATILASAELRSNAPIELLCRESGYREHVVRHALRRLRERNVMMPVPFINLHRIGLNIYSVFFTAGGESKGARQNIVKALVAAPEVLWVGEFGGEYQYGMSFCAKRLPSLLEFLRNLSRRHQQIFVEKAVSVQISATAFPRKYLTTKKFSVGSVTVKSEKDFVEIDKLDARILSALTSFGDLSHRQVAMKLQIPLSTLELRVRKLREHGVIAADIFMVDPAAFDRQSFKLLVYTKGLDPQVGIELHKFCAQHSDVTYLIECFGSWGFEVGLEVLKAEDVSTVMQELYEQFGAAINTIKLLSKFRYPKVRFFPDGKDWG